MPCVGMVETVKHAGTEKASKFSLETRLKFFVLHVFVAMGIR